MTANKKVIKRVGDIYNWLDEQLSGQKALCEICGKCCDFKSFDHRLFVTTPEMVFFRDKVGSQNIKKMTNGKCPYQRDHKCTVYPYRFAGCRLFFCKADPDFQSKLTESTIKNSSPFAMNFKFPTVMSIYPRR